jgi:uncharacterized coiled-coil protein SlyX
MEERLTRLEELFSNQTHTIDQMSLEIFRQQKEIAALKGQFEMLKEKLENPENEIGGHEPPPHY